MIPFAEIFFSFNIDLLRLCYVSAYGTRLSKFIKLKGAELQSPTEEVA